MNLSHIKITPVHGDDKVLAYVSLTIDDCLAVRDIKIIKGDRGPFLSFPAKKMKDGTFKDLFHPLDAATRRLFERRVLSEYAFYASANAPGPY